MHCCIQTSLYEYKNSFGGNVADRKISASKVFNFILFFQNYPLAVKFGQSVFWDFDLLEH